MLLLYHHTWFWVNSLYTKKRRIYYGRTNYAHYAEMEELNDMTDESLILDIDIIEKQYEKALAKTRSDLAVKEALLDVKNAILAEAYHTITQTNSTLARKEALLAEKESEIARLNAEIAKMKQR